MLSETHIEFIRKHNGQTQSESKHPWGRKGKDRVTLIKILISSRVQRGT